MNRIAISTVAIAALLGLSACGVSAEKAASPATSAPETSQAATAAPSAAPSPSAKPKDNHNALIVKFGETIEYADGMQVTVKHTGTVTGSQYAAPEAARGAEVQIFEITLVNGTGKTFEPAGFYDTAVYGKTGVKAEKVFDSGQGVSAGYFSGIMVPGGTQTVTTALAVPTADLPTLLLTVQPTFAHKAAAVTGGL